MVSCVLLNEIFDWSKEYHMEHERKHAIHYGYHVFCDKHCTIGDTVLVQLRRCPAKKYATFAGMSKLVIAPVPKIILIRQLSVLTWYLS